MSSPALFKPLSITPVHFSLTEGTNIPAPPPEPVASSHANGNGTAATITAEGLDGPAPLSSSQPTLENGSLQPNGNGVPHSHPTQTNYNGQNTPSPFPTTTTTTTTESKRPSSVRKLLSLRCIRSEKDKQLRFSTVDGSASRNGTGNGNGNGNLSKHAHSIAFPVFTSRPGSPYTIDTIMSSSSSNPALNRKRSSAWFGSRRKSGFFPINIGRVGEDAVGEGGAVQMPAKAGPPPPAIPEFTEFGSVGADMDDEGSLGAEDMFKDIK